MLLLDWLLCKSQPIAGQVAIMLVLKFPRMNFLSSILDELSNKSANNLDYFIIFTVKLPVGKQQINFEHFSGLSHCVCRSSQRPGGDRAAAL